MKPLVSILICAYNAEKTLGDTLQSAVSQSWQPKEIIVLNDGSADRTAEVARRFKGVIVVSTENRGFATAQNHAFSLCHGEYIQYLDSDDILAPKKIERQIAALKPGDGRRKLLSSQWAPFFFRTRTARFVHNPLCEDGLSPVEWLLRKMGQDCHMQNATWLVNRELVEKAGPWDTNLNYDQDGEFFCRVLLASEGTRFVPGTGVYYRCSGVNSISFIGNSNLKKDSLFRSIKLHIQYLRSLEESERVRKACLAYMQKWLVFFYGSRPDLVAESQRLAAQLNGQLEEPTFRWKYNWLKKVFGYQAAYNAQFFLPQFKADLLRSLDQAMFRLENRKVAFE